MRAGKLDTLISLEAQTHVIDEYGSPVYSWTEFAPARAEIIQSSTTEFIRAHGVADDTIMIFRIRFLAGLTVDHRVTANGQHYDIKEIKEIGRRQILELRCIKKVGR